MRAGLYLRLSREDGEGESQSIASQRLLLTNYCAQQGIPIGGEYVDDGYSGTNFQRPAFLRLLADIEAGLIDVVITKEDCVIIELNQKALENRDFVMWFCFFDPKTDTFYTLLAQGGGARRVERPQQHS